MFRFVLIDFFNSSTVLSVRGFRAFNEYLLKLVISIKTKHYCFHNIQSVKKQKNNYCTYFYADTSLLSVPCSNTKATIYERAQTVTISLNLSWCLKKFQFNPKTTFIIIISEFSSHKGCNLWRSPKSCVQVSKGSIEAVRSDCLKERARARTSLVRSSALALWQSEFFNEFFFFLLLLRLLRFLPSICFGSESLNDSIKRPLLGTIQIICDTLGQCFSTFFDWRHLSFLIEQFGGTQNNN